MNRKVKFEEVKRGQVFQSSGNFFIRIYQNDLDEFGIDCVNAVGLAFGGLTKFYPDEDVIVFE